MRSRYRDDRAIAGLPECRRHLPRTQLRVFLQDFDDEHRASRLPFRLCEPCHLAIPCARRGMSEEDGGTD